MTTLRAHVLLSLLLLWVGGPGMAQAAGVPDHAAWDGLLQRYAKDGGFRYAALAEDAAARAQLQAYLQSIAEMPESAPLSAWLNAYNATVVAAVLERYPLQSVMDVAGFFKKQKHRIAGKPRTLDEVEHGIIRKRFEDARIHVALNCGARSCPTLHPHAFQEGTLDATLNRLARAMVQSDTHVRKAGAGKLAISALFFWFRADFDRDFGGPLGFIRKFGGKAYANLPPSTKTAQLDYDWQLNAAQ